MGACMAARKWNSYLSKSKWPGWIFIVIAFFNGVPEWHDHAMFWVVAAKELQGHLGRLAMFVSSPWLNAGLVVVGVLYVVVVGEVEKPLRGHPGWLFLGWGAVGMLMLAFWSVLVAGYVASHSIKSEYEWTTLTKAQSDQIAVVVGKLPKRNVEIFRPDRTDCEALADSFAAIFESKWNLLSAPYQNGFSAFGITILGNPTDSATLQLQSAMTKALNYQVDIESAQPGTFSQGSIADVGILIGNKKNPSFLRGNSQAVVLGATTATIKIDAPLSYTANAWTSWGATATVTDVEPTFFVVKFSSPAIVVGNYQPDIHWMAFHYP
jgi:hypothetical protein